MTDANQVRINELARELEVKAKAIIDLLPGFGVTEKKTHSSSIPVDVAEKVRKQLQGVAEAGSGGSGRQSGERGQGSRSESGEDEANCTCAIRGCACGGETGCSRCACGNSDKACCYSHPRGGCADGIAYCIQDCSQGACSCACRSTNRSEACYTYAHAETCASSSACWSARSGSGTPDGSGRNTRFGVASRSRRAWCYRGASRCADTIDRSGSAISYWKSRPSADRKSRAVAGRIA